MHAGVGLSVLQGCPFNNLPLGGMHAGVGVEMGSGLSLK